MEQIEWNEKFSVGIETIDSQHKNLLKLINRIISKNEIKTKSETVSTLINSMTQYAQEHFRTEEKYMKEYAYPNLDEHAEQHRAFIKKTVDICTATMLDVEQVPEVILHYLKTWWNQHILEEDMSYKSFFKEKGVK